MSNSRLIVLKFGGSVLQQQDDVHQAAQEIYRWRRKGYQVVAVVSAIGDTTNRLSELTQSFGKVVDPGKTALLLATGELQSASMLGLALDRAGISSFVCDDASIGLKTSGPILDARLVGVDVSLLRNKLQQRGVVVLPGFIGRGESGQLTLLGRGGSDLTALYIAANLDASRCRLVKDVDGLYEYDPHLAEDGLRPRRFKFVTFEDALSLDESIVQHKAVHYARDEDMPFEVASVANGYSTRVGRFSCSTFYDAETAKSAEKAPLRVALLGLGTVGLGVYRQSSELFAGNLNVVSVAVRDRARAIENGVPEELIADNVDEAIQSDCDVVVELVGGTDLPRNWVIDALTSGKHVVTANKALMAAESSRLQQIARENGVEILFSAAVGGSVPVLEIVQQLSLTDEVLEVVGILNGSTNFVLDELAGGASLPEALSTAHEFGLTEADPLRDIGGIDAAEKLVLIARTCGADISLNEIDCVELTADLIDGFDGANVRQLAQLRLPPSNGSGQATAQVSISAVVPPSVFSRVHGAGNLVEITTKNSGKIVLHGLGAGRWPTTASVVADLLELWSDVIQTSSAGAESIELLRTWSR